MRLQDVKKNTFRMRVGDALSWVHVQENGVPQGAVLSCMLFIITMNLLGEGLPSTISRFICVGDVQMSFYKSYLREASLAWCQQTC